MLAAFELSSLLPENGGDGSAGFVGRGTSIFGTAGFNVSASGDVNGDGYADFLISDPGASTIDQKGGSKQEIYETAVYVVFGNGSGHLPEVDLTLLDGVNGFAIHGNPDDGASGNYFDFNAVPADGGDINGDGIDDLAITYQNGFEGLGRAYVVYGQADFPATIELRGLLAENGGDGSQGTVLSGAEGRRIGFAASIRGDVNNDGLSDLVIGDWNENQVAVIYGDATPAAERSLADLDGTNGFMVTGHGAGELFGHSVATNGDLNGDGVFDLAIGAPRSDPESGTPEQRTEAGQILVLYGRADYSSLLDGSGVLDASAFLAGNGDATVGFVINGIDGDEADGAVDGAGRDVAGVSIDSGGDFNGDGLADLAIGAPRSSGANGDVDVGEAYIVFGRAANFPAELELSSLEGIAGLVVQGLDPDDRFGRHVALGDLNGDSIADLAITAPGGDPDGRTDAGEAYVVYGTSDAGILAQVAPNGVIDLQAILDGDGSRGFVINGVEAGEELGGRNAGREGNTLSIGADADGSSYLMLGQTGGTNAAYVLRGGPNVLPPPPAPSFSIDDVEVTEGDSGTVTATFTVTRSGDSSGTDTVGFATADGSASLGDNDYVETFGTLTFNPGVTSLPVEVIVNGDVVEEGGENFVVNLSNASAGASIDDGEGVGTILDDDAPVDANVIYLWDIQDSLQTRQRGKNFTDYRVVVDVRQDSDSDGVAEITDAAMAGVAVTVELRDTGGNLIDTLTGVTNDEGLFESEWIKGLAPGDYRAEVIDLALAGFSWDPFDLLDATDNDEDDEENPYELYTVV